MKTLDETNTKRIGIPQIQLYTTRTQFQVISLHVEEGFDGKTQEIQNASACFELNLHVHVSKNGCSLECNARQAQATGEGNIMGTWRFEKHRKRKICKC